MRSQRAIHHGNIWGYSEKNDGAVQQWDSDGTPDRATIQHLCLKLADVS